jgi:hypothetical protein
MDLYFSFLDSSFLLYNFLLTQSLILGKGNEINKNDLQFKSFSPITIGNEDSHVTA